eukprot:TRINITY_DN9094_c0_g1_i5.p1 TRINITY_DN9094_c0_g1~~TRINITY_DN9094_c0_g1_i5.p1  ORF type:complete len:180 (-),score=24.60 TRINITY_DN9094_c0_g1_i5:355-894(-)
MDPFDRERVVKILQDVSVELTEENDDDWINFLTDEIMQSTDDINSELSLNNVIGEHLSAITTPSKVSQYIHLIFSRLVDKEKHEEPEEVEILEDEDGEVLEDGSCLICERFMPLTKHHLVPRETHTWYPSFFFLEGGGYRCTRLTLQVQKTPWNDPCRVTYWNNDLSSLSFFYTQIYRQ